MTPSVDALIQQAQIAEREGRRDDARSLYERALYSLKRAQDGKIASSLLRWVGRTYQLDADADAALDCLEAAIAVAELTGDAAAIGHAINVQGNVHQQQGHLDQAEALYLEARSHAIDAGRDAPRRDDGAEPRRHLRDSRRPREGAALLSNEPRGVPHARRAEGSAAAR